MNIKKPTWANANFIKIIALLSMTLDHIGWILFDGQRVLNILGRISFPLFAYMVAEGSIYTRNRLKRILSIFSVGIICQIFFFIFEQSLDLNIFLTFSMSLVLIMTLQKAEEDKSLPLYILFGVLSGIFFGISEILPNKITEYYFNVQYGAVGVFLPVAVYLIKNKWLKLIAVAVFMITFSITNQTTFYLWSLFSLVFLAMYNGKGGKLKLKYLFYFYFPLHFAVIYGISLII